MQVIQPGRAGGHAYRWPAGSAGRASGRASAGRTPGWFVADDAMAGTEMPSTPSPAAAATAAARRVSNTARTVPPLLTVDLQFANQSPRISERTSEKPRLH